MTAILCLKIYALKSPDINIDDVVTTIDLLVGLGLKRCTLQRNGHGKINVVGLMKLCLSKDYEQTMLSLHLKKIKLYRFKSHVHHDWMERTCKHKSANI